MHRQTFMHSFTHTKLVCVMCTCVCLWNHSNIVLYFSSLFSCCNSFDAAAAATAVAVDYTDFCFHFVLFGSIAFVFKHRFRMQNERAKMTMMWAHVRVWVWAICVLSRGLHVMEFEYSVEYRYVVSRDQFTNTGMHTHTHAYIEKGEHERTIIHSISLLRWVLACLLNDDSRRKRWHASYGSFLLPVDLIQLLQILNANSAHLTHVFPIYYKDFIQRWRCR